MNRAAPARVRAGRRSEAGALARLLHDSVHVAAAGAYDARQRAAWSPAPAAAARMLRRHLARARLWVAEIDGHPVGFVTLERRAARGRIGLFYVAGSHARRGVGARLYAALRAEARRRGLAPLTVEASLVAEPFFAARGFRCVRRERVRRKGAMLARVRMARM